jgi:hypothetical protein
MPGPQTAQTVNARAAEGAEGSEGSDHVQFITKTNQPLHAHKNNAMRIRATNISDKAGHKGSR